MSDSIHDLHPEDFPSLLREIPAGPKKLRIEGQLPIEGNLLLAVVGARKYSSYGREMCESIIGGLAGYPITIVSGLAFGIDSIAHRAAIRNKLQTIGIPGSGLSRAALHPQAHIELADQIVDVLRSGKTVAVPCRQGIWRSAMMIAAALIAGGLDAETAVNAIRQSRGLDVPETQAQRRWISDFFSWLPSRRAAQQQHPADGPSRRS